MTEANNATSGAKGGTSGSPDENSNQNSHVEKLTKELNNYRKKVQDLDSKITELENEKALSANNYKELYEKQKTTIEELKSADKAKEAKLTNAHKRDAVSKALLKYNLNEKHLDTAMKLVDSSKLHVDPDTGTVFGAEELAKNFYEENKDLGYFKKSNFNPNHRAPDGKKINEMPNLAKMSQAEKIQYLRDRERSKE